MFDIGADSKAAPPDKAVSVGYYAPDGKRPPVLPRGYHLHPFDLSKPQEGAAFQICLLEENAPDGLRLELLSRVEDQWYVIVLVEEVPGAERQMRLLSGGADEVVSSRDPAQLALALKRGAGIAEKQARLRRRCQDLAVERDNLQAAIDNLPSPIFFKNRAGIYSGCNKAFEGFIGLPAAKVRGSSVYDVAPQELAKVYEEADEALMREGGIQIYDAEVRFATGEYRTVTFHKAVTRDSESGEVNGLAGAMLDITERKKLEDQLTRAAERDDLTEAYNRRRFFELAAEADRSVPLSVLVLDVDYFKLLNDRHGHACGDTALCHLVSLLDTMLDHPHVFARAGGEEFYILLEDCDPEEAFQLAERIRATVEATPHQHEDKEIPLRVSIGVATAGKNEAVNQVIVRADDALYRAKQAGRNRVCAD
ncbi:sensor domain-containing diguanylate cyclase [Roseibium sp. Sym1]|uniref:sensor domain-containing diguanylate cyclase n=1 Tax=Roseibium sp. Sym1 TaxID=3016006 RepID=UPI0022B443E7|nr:diguanylate cyclase [Roseibium sp. Sym1]